MWCETLWCAQEEPRSKVGEQHCCRMTRTDWPLFSNKLGVNQIREEALKRRILQSEIVLFIMSMFSLLIRLRWKTPHQERGMGISTRTWTCLNPLNSPPPTTLINGLLHRNNQVLSVDAGVVKSFPSAIYSYPFSFFLFLPFTYTFSYVVFLHFYLAVFLQMKPKQLFSFCGGFFTNLPQGIY